MAPDNLDRLNLLLGDLLAASAAGLGDPPARQYVSHGQPVHDCNQLTVHAAGLRAVGIPSPSDLPPRNAVVVTVATVVVELVRCGTSDANPTAAQLGADGAALATDGWELWRHLLRSWRSGALLPSLPDVEPEAVTWGPMQPINAEGGLIGWTLAAEVRL